MENRFPPVCVDVAGALPNKLPDAGWEDWAANEPKRPLLAGAENCAVDEPNGGPLDPPPTAVPPNNEEPLGWVVEEFDVLILENKLFDDGAEVA